MPQIEQNLPLFPDDDQPQMVDAAEILTSNDVGLPDASDADTELPDDAISTVPQKTKKAAFFEGSEFEFDGSLPLANVRFEQFLQFLVAGKEQYVAYQLAGHSDCARETAGSQASRLMRRKDVRARLRFLWDVEKRGKKADEREGKMSKAEMEEVLTTAARTAINVSDKVQAVKALQAIRGAGQGRRAAPDPAFLAEYLRVAEEQGKDPVELAKTEMADPQQVVVEDGNNEVENEKPQVLEGIEGI
jgi:hypothetical protein